MAYVIIAIFVPKQALSAEDTIYVHYILYYSIPIPSPSSPPPPQPLATTSSSCMWGECDCVLSSVLLSDTDVVFGGVESDSWPVNHDSCTWPIGGMLVPLDKP